jgi:hypothetical protein
MSYRESFRWQTPVGWYRAILWVTAAGIVAGRGFSDSQDAVAADAPKPAPPVKKQADDNAISEYPREFEAMKPGERNLLILPLRTELQRSGSRSAC